MSKTNTEAVEARYYCNKCGYFGPNETHIAPGHDRGPCPYIAALSLTAKTEPSAAGLVEELRAQAIHKKSNTIVVSRELRDNLIAALSAPTRERELLEACKLQLEYMDERSPSGTTPAIIARIDNLLNEGSGQ